MATIAQAKPILEAYIANDIPAFLWGAPGIGKSDLAREVSRDAMALLIDFRANLKAPEDMAGLPALDIAKGETKWMRPGGLPFVGSSFATDKPIYLFMDELNTAAPAMQAACFGLVLDRRIGDHVLLPNVRILAAGNRQSDKAAAQRMPSALANRFAHIDVDACPVAFRTWAARNSISPMVAAFIAFRPAMLHVMPQGEARAFPTPRAWAQVSKLVSLNDELRPVAIAGLIGESAATEFEAFRLIYTQAPKPELIIRDPKGAPVPADIGVRYALATALARIADKVTLSPIMEYLARLSDEFATVCMMDATARAPELQETVAYNRFLTRNGAAAL